MPAKRTRFERGSTKSSQRRAETGQRQTIAMTDAEPGSIGAVAVEVLRQQFEATRLHAPGAREGADPEEVHDMRVAIRRLRAALRSFADVLPKDWEGVRSELKWLGGSLS